MEPGIKKILWKDPETSHELANDVPYRPIIGCLMFLLIRIRPDIAFAVCCLVKFYEEPINPHSVAVERIIRYIAGIRNQCITHSIP